MRAIAASVALLSIISLILATAFFAGSDVTADDADEGNQAAATQVPTVTPTPIVLPTSSPVPTPAPVATPTPASVAIVRLADDEPAPSLERIGPADAAESAEPAEPARDGQWCVGPRPVDARLGPQDAAEVIGQIDPGVCDLETLAEVQEGWIAVRSGTDLTLIEGWVWAAELVPNE